MREPKKNFPEAIIDCQMLPKIFIVSRSIRTRASIIEKHLQIQRKGPDISASVSDKTELKSLISAFSDS